LKILLPRVRAVRSGKVDGSEEGEWGEEPLIEKNVLKGQGETPKMLLVSIGDNKTFSLWSFKGT